MGGGEEEDSHSAPAWLWLSHPGIPGAAWLGTWPGCLQIMDFPAPEFSLVLETWTWQYEPVQALIKIWDLFISCAALASINTGREDGRSWLKKCQCLAQRQQLVSYHEILKLRRLRPSSSFGQVKTPACLGATIQVPGWGPGRDLRAQRGVPTSQQTGDAARGL